MSKISTVTLCLGVAMSGTAMADAFPANGWPKDMQSSGQGDARDTGERLSDVLVTRPVCARDCDPEGGDAFDPFDPFDWRRIH